MTITITHDDDRVYATHQLCQQAAAYLGHKLAPEMMPKPHPDTEPEPYEADDVIEGLVSACQREIIDPSYGDTTPYENGEPGWCRTLRSTR